MSIYGCNIIAEGKGVCSTELMLFNVAVSEMFVVKMHRIFIFENFDSKYSNRADYSSTPLRIISTGVIKHGVNCNSPRYRGSTIEHSVETMPIEKTGNIKYSIVGSGDFSKIGRHFGYEQIVEQKKSRLTSYDSSFLFAVGDFRYNTSTTKKWDAITNSRYKCYHPELKSYDSYRAARESCVDRMFSAYALENASPVLIESFSSHYDMPRIENPRMKMIDFDPKDTSSNIMLYDYRFKVSDKFINNNEVSSGFKRAAALINRVMYSRVKIDGHSQRTRIDTW